MTRAPVIALNKGQRLLPAQDSLLRSRARIRAILGGWRSGKTMGAALAFLANCLANPWTEDYGEDRPWSMVVGYTHKVLVDSAHAALKNLIPREIILRERKSPSLEIELTNGHVIRFRTVKGAIEGATCCGVWIDEAHKIPTEKVFVNLLARASDPLARASLFLLSGVPEEGWLREKLDRPEHRADPDRFLVLCSANDNHYLPDHVLANMRSSTSYEAADKYIGGKWQAPAGVIYSGFSLLPYPGEGHLWNWPGDKSRPVHVGMDVGDLGAILLMQEVTRKFPLPGGRVLEAKGLHVVHEILPEKMSTLEACRMIKASGWRLDGNSKICVDPTLSADEIASIRTVFGSDVGIVRAKRGTEQEQVEYGIRCVQAALRDADKRVRLTFWSGLPRDQRSILTVLGRYHRGPTGKPVRDNKVDHAVDSLRYPVAHFLPVRVTVAEAA
jgi:hypothetical protein